MWNAIKVLVGPLGGTALLCLIVGCGEGTSGTVVDVQHSSVTVAEPETYEQTTYRVAPDADISRDGAPASLLEIQPGDEIDITVTTDDVGANVATAVEATSNFEADDADPTATDVGAAGDSESVDEGEFAPTDTTAAEAPAEPMTYAGRVTTTLDGAMMIEHAEDQEIQIMVDENAEVLVDGVAAWFADILPGYEVMVVADEDYGQLHALRIEATSSTVVDPAPPAEPLPESPDGDVSPDDSPPDNSVPPVPETPQRQP